MNKSVIFVTYINSVQNVRNMSKNASLIKKEDVKIIVVDFVIVRI
jgi:hypothetical protein